LGAKIITILRTKKYNTWKGMRIYEQTKPPPPQNYYRHPYLTDKPIVLYPAGEYGRKMLKTLTNLGVKPIAFCDKDEAKIGTIINGVVVRELDNIINEFGSKGCKYLVNSVRNYTMIEALLISKGVAKDHILTPDIYRYCDTGIIERPIEVTAADAAKLKKCLLDLLEFFHGVCEKYNIPYYLTYGTLLGAVRHKGFIPWDDDIDVAMLRKDYNRFYRVVKKELGSKYAIQDILNRKNIGLRNTTKRGFAGNFPWIIDIDTFPIDYVFDFPNAFNKFQETASLKLYSLAAKYRWHDRQSRTFILGRFFRVLGMIVVQLCNCFETGFIHDFEPDTRHIRRDRIFAKRMIGKRALVYFEGRGFYAPEHFDDYLRQMYHDDYMELPPPELRVQSHAWAELNFGSN
jgi:lipopolysaccharide cholinephosphotransferase